MSQKILQLKNRDNSVKEFNECIRQGIPSAVFGVTDAFKNYMVAALDEKVLFIAKDAVSARYILEGVTELSRKKAVYLPPKDEVLLHSRAFSKDNLYARIDALYNISTADIVITTAESLMQTVPKNIKALKIVKDTDLSQDGTVTKLVQMGYSRVDTVASKGTFALRGDILDVFPINGEKPYRVDFFGDEVESIAEYDLNTGLKKNKVEALRRGAPA